MMDFSALGTPGLYFIAAHIGLTQLIRQFGRWRSNPIQDGWAVFLSLVVGAILGVLMLTRVSADAGIDLPPPFGGMVMGVVVAAANSGLIAKITGFQKDGARYQANATVEAAIAVKENRPMTQAEMDDLLRSAPAEIAVPLVVGPGHGAGDTGVDYS